MWESYFQLSNINSANVYYGMLGEYAQYIGESSVI